MREEMLKRIRREGKQELVKWGAGFQSPLWGLFLLAVVLMG